MDKRIENFEFYRGDTYVRNIILENVQEKIDEIYFTVRSTEKAKVLIQKKIGRGIEVVAVEDNGTTYKIILRIEATDTDQMQADFEYFYDLELIAGDSKRTILEGTIILAADYTRTRNEV